MTDAEEAEVARWFAGQAETAIETACARVYLAGERAFKVKRRVDLGYLDYSTLDLRQLLEELSRQICEGMGASDHVRVDVDVPSRVVAGGVAVALALFTVEALTNIFKHAFPVGRGGVIRVTMESQGDGRLRLAIADNGIGFVDGEASKSVGSRLIKTFGLQLGGVSQVRSVAGEGTVVELIFPDPDLSPPSPTDA